MKTEAFAVLVLCACGGPLPTLEAVATAPVLVVFDGSLGKVMRFQSSEVAGDVVHVRGELRNEAGNGDYNRTQVELFFFDDTGDAMGGVIVADLVAQLEPGEWQTLDADLVVPPLRAPARTAQLMLLPLYAVGRHLVDVRLSTR